MIAALAGHGPPAHRVWLPPLDAPPPLDELLGARRPAGARARGAGAAALRARRRWSTGPTCSAATRWSVDLAGAAGHLAVVGGPRAGKSTALATVRARRSR